MLRECYGANEDGEVLLGSASRHGIVQLRMQKSWALDWVSIMVLHSHPNRFGIWRNRTRYALADFIRDREGLTICCFFTV